MMAYLVMMAPRLVEMHRVLKPAGSLYLHCDPTASHYIKLLLDAVFGPQCFRNEIIWSYRRRPSPTKAFQRMHDVIFFYSRTEDGPGTFHVEYEPNSPSYIRRFKGKTQILDPVTRTRKIPVDAPSKGLPRRDVWEIPIIAGSSKERLGYPTQKPQALLQRIILASSNEGDLVLDPFSGCGTAVAVAERFRRRWIGIDITYLAIDLIRRRLHRTFGSELAPYEVIGVPKDLPSARALAQQNRHQFQLWALGLVDAGAVNDGKKGADRGIDGIILFFDDDSGQAKTLVVQVKSGHVSVRDVRDLKGVMEREKAPIGALITLEPPTREMLKEAAAAGFYVPDYEPLHKMRYPRVQILTVEQLLAGQKLSYPRLFVEATYRRAVRQTKRQVTQEGLEGLAQAAEPPPPRYRVRRRATRAGEPRPAEQDDEA